MTNDEKAEKFIKEKLCFFCKEEKNKAKCATCPTFLTAYISYLDGLADGRKETCQKVLNEIKSHEGIEQMTKFYIGEIIKNLGDINE